MDIKLLKRLWLYEKVQRLQWRVLGTHPLLVQFLTFSCRFLLCGVLILLIFLQNSSEHQILWSLCSVVFYAFTLKLPIQTSLSVAP